MHISNISQNTRALKARLGEVTKCSLSMFFTPSFNASFFSSCSLCLNTALLLVEQTANYFC